MEDLLKEENKTTEEMWRAWEEKNRIHGKAIARKMKICAGVVIGVLALVFAYYALIAK